MEISFQTKEESNRLQREAFLKLSPSERVVSFFRLMQQVNNFPTKINSDNKNFIVIIEDA